MTLLIKLILAHLLGDFLLQPDAWVMAKENKKLKAYQLYLHTTIHYVLIMLLIWDISFWKWALLLALFHLTIDISKLFAQTERTKRTFFFADQIIHLFLIYLIWLWYQGNCFPFQHLFNEQSLWLITAIYALTQPSAVIIKLFISKWTPQTGKNDSDSLQKAGKYIGILERLFVFAFVVMNHWEAVGFLIAAKSVFRFGDLKESKERMLTEYILIGTLVSFGMAILIGVIYLKLPGL